MKGWSKVKKIHQQVKGAYGARRISEELKAEGEAYGQCVENGDLAP